MLFIKDIPVDNKVVLVRLDLNVPLLGENILDDFRIRCSLPTLRYLLKKNCKIIAMSHLGRPQQHSKEEFSLMPVKAKLSTLLDFPVHLFSDIDHIAPSLDYISLLENVRFNAGETSNCQQLAKSYADLADIFILDAFACSHRQHASIFGVLSYIAVAGVGFLFKQECSLIDKVFLNVKKPFLAIIGGAKVSSKLSLLHSLAAMNATIIVGGGIANTFLAANGFSVGSSIYDQDLLQEAILIQNKTKVLLPVDVLVDSVDADKNTNAILKNVDEIKASDAIFDVGVDSRSLFLEEINSANTIIWNGPIGLYENQSFAFGTKAVAQAISESKASKIIGGGDTVAAINILGVTMPSDCISTAGGAFLSYIEDGFVDLKQKLNSFV